jgi:hypothetical protein
MIMYNYKSGLIKVNTFFLIGVVCQMEKFSLEILHNLVHIQTLQSASKTSAFIESEW